MKKKTYERNLIYLLTYPAGSATFYLCTALILTIFFDVKITAAKLVSQTFIIIITVIIIVLLKKFIPPDTVASILKLWRIAKKHTMAYYHKGTRYNRFMVIFYALCIIFLFIVLSWTIITRLLY